MTRTKRTGPRIRTKDDALATAQDAEPIWLTRLLIIQKNLDETMETMYAQSRRRNEAVYELAHAGVSYRDLARIIDVSPERIRQLAAAHLDVSVNDLNPKPKTAENRH